MIDDFRYVLESQAKLFNKCILDRLEAFNDFYPVHSQDAIPQGFPFLNLISREYYLQKTLEPTLECFVRCYLFNGVFLATLPEQFHFRFLEPSYDGDRPNKWSNKECDEVIKFDFIETEGNIKRGFRYSEPPYSKEKAKPFLESIRKEKIDEVVILDMSSLDTIDSNKSNYRTFYDSINIKRMSIKEFFIKYYNLECYNSFVSFLFNTINQYKDYTGIITIPKLTPHYLFSFRFRVENEIKKHISIMEEFKGHRDVSKLPDGFTVGYHFVIPKNANKKHYRNLEKRSQELLCCSGLLKKYKTSKIYRALIGKSDFARCFQTSEYLYFNFNGSDQFDYTAIVSGYLKSVEQLIHVNVEHFEPSKSITMMGPMLNYIQEHPDIISLSDERFKNTMINCLFCYKSECRNDNLHLHNIDEWEIVTCIRNNTLFVLMLLLCGFNIISNIDNLFAVADDGLSRLYYQMITHDEINYGIQFEDGQPIWVDRPVEEQYEEFDKYGLIKRERLIISGCTYDDLDDPNHEKTAIPITNYHLPQKLWIEGDGNTRTYLEI